MATVWHKVDSMNGHKISGWDELRQKGLRSAWARNEGDKTIILWGYFFEGMQGSAWSKFIPLSRLKQHYLARLPMLPKALEDARALPDDHPRKATLALPAYPFEDSDDEDEALEMPRDILDVAEDTEEDKMRREELVQLPPSASAECISIASSDEELVQLPPSAASAGSIEKPNNIVSMLALAKSSTPNDTYHHLKICQKPRRIRLSRKTAPDATTATGSAPMLKRNAAAPSTAPMLKRPAAAQLRAKLSTDFNLQEMVDKAAAVCKDPSSPVTCPGTLAWSYQRDKHHYQVKDGVTRRAKVQMTCSQAGSNQAACDIAHVLLTLHNAGASPQDLQRCKLSGIFGFKCGKPVDA